MRRVLGTAGRHKPWRERNSTLLWRGSAGWFNIQRTHHPREAIMATLQGPEFSQYFRVRAAQLLCRTCGQFVATALLVCALGGVRNAPACCAALSQTAHAPDPW
jgi:hypothetical protein